MKKKQWIVAAAGVVFAVALSSGCRSSMEKTDASGSIIGGAEETSEIVLDGEFGNVDVESSKAGVAEAQVSETSGLLEQLAGSSWRLADSKTEEHLKQYRSLQGIWGTGIHYGSGMEIGADGSFSFHIAINYGGSGKVAEQDGTLVADITPYAEEWGENTAGTPERLVITPVEEEGVLYLTTPYNEEVMYWEQLESSCSFADFSNLQFRFSSGAGAWATELEIHEDGSFSGEYYDSDMGDRSENYPNGVQYRCDFSGQFTELEKVNAYTYSMKIAEMNYEKETDTEEIKDGILYRYSEAYGLAGAENILIYLPNTPVLELPKEFLMWVRCGEDEIALPFYGLYNEAKELGFSSFQRVPVNDSQLASHLIEDQYFDQYLLDGWENAAFAAFRPDLSVNPDGDVEFMLLKDGEVIYRFPGYNSGNTVTDHPFCDVRAVAFRDVDGDGRYDILIISRYGTDADNAVSSVRIYSQREGKKEFVLDKFEPSMEEFLNQNHYNNSIADVEKGIGQYWES